VAEVAPVGLVGDSTAAAVGLGDFGEHTADAGEHVRERRHMGRVVGMREHPCVRGFEPVAALLCVPAIDLE
jgi:hypothetical protein